MSVNDPIGDMLTRIRNACMARHTTVSMPASKMKMAIAEKGLMVLDGEVKGKAGHSARNPGRSRGATEAYRWRGSVLRLVAGRRKHHVPNWETADPAA